MKRFHVHVVVADLEASIRFYSTVFGAAPALIKPDYAKWMVEDPRVNFAISTRGSAAGIDHLGIQVDSDEELAAMREQVTGAKIAAQEQANAECCYARSDKYWTTDPQGIAWETFHTLDAIPVSARQAVSRSELAAARPRWSIPHLTKTARAAPDRGHHETGNLECSVSMHRQFGAQHHGRGDPELDRAK